MSASAPQGEAPDRLRAARAKSRSSSRAPACRRGRRPVSVIRRENAWRTSDAGVAAAEGGSAKARTATSAPARPAYVRIRLAPYARRAACINPNAVLRGSLYLSLKKRAAPIATLRGWTPPESQSASSCSPPRSASFACAASCRSCSARTGFPRRSAVPAAFALIAAELGVAALLIADVAGAAYAALALGVVFVAAAVLARLRGAKRVPCGCFGAHERPWTLVLARALGFTGLAALAAFGDGLELGAPSRDGWIVIALIVLGAAVVLLGLLVLALYRQVGVLTLRISPRAPRSSSQEEGPPLATPAPALSGLARRGTELVTFFSEDCRVCRELAPWSSRARARGRRGARRLRGGGRRRVQPLERARLAVRRPRGGRRRGGQGAREQPRAARRR